jgi:hypothetical protein
MLNMLVHDRWIRVCVKRMNFSRCIVLFVRCFWYATIFVFETSMSKNDLSLLPFDEINEDIHDVSYSIVTVGNTRFHSRCSYVLQTLEHHLLVFAYRSFPDS